MKPEELMIGDLVLYKDKPIMVWEIDEYYNRINTEPDGYNAITCVEISDIKPIPLTDEILEGNEFYYESNVGQVWDDGEYEVIVDLYDVEIRVIKNRKEILSLEYFDKIYVHELQHALRLCEINKEIKV